MTTLQLESERLARALGPEDPEDLGGNSFPVTEYYRGTRLDRFLQAMIPRLSRQRVKRAIRSRVAVSWHDAPRPSLRVVPGGRVIVRHVRVAEPDLPDVRPSVIHEDGALLAVDKPAGLLVHPTHTCRQNNLVHLLRAERPGERIALAHRLDRETSGILLVARTVEASRSLSEQFARGSVYKRYVALVHGRVERDTGTHDRPIGISRRLDVLFKRCAGGERAREARTDFRVLHRYDRFTLLELHPRTGRRHQIRAHLADAGHPIVGDKLYATDDQFYIRFMRRGLDPEMERRLLAGRQLLHASALSFLHPDSGARVHLSAPLPDDFSSFLAGLAGSALVASAPAVVAAG